MDANVEIQRAYEEAKRKKFASARAILRNVLAAEPSNVDAWVAFAGVAQKPEHELQCLKKAARLDPTNAKVQRLLADLQQSPSNGKKSSEVVAQNPPRKAGEPVQAAPPAQADGLPQAYSPDAAYSPAEVYSPEAAYSPGFGAGDELDVEPLASIEYEQPAQSPSAPHDPVNAFLESLRTNDAQPTPPAALLAPDHPQTESVSHVVTDQPKPAKKGRTLEVVLLVALVGVVCLVMTVLGAMILSSLPVVSVLFQAQPTPDANAITAPIYANITASNAEDVNAYMTTIHSQSPVYAQTESMLSPMFVNYDLSFEITNLNLLKQTQNEARVAFILVTRKIRGPEFKDNQVSGVMILRPENGAWKIYNQEVEAVEYLK